MDASGLYLNLKRISIDNHDGSIEIPLIDTVVDLTTQIIVVKSKYAEDFVIYLTSYEVDQIEVILTNYINLLEEAITVKDLI